MYYHIITLFEQGIRPYLETSMLGRAAKDKKISLNFYNPRMYTDNKHHRVDQKPYGGGPGMVLEALPFLEAWNDAKKAKKDFVTIGFSPSAKQFTQADALRLSTHKHIAFLCGHYEGLDERVHEATNAQLFSIGPYVLTGGEAATIILIDAITRMIPYVLGNNESLEGNRIASPTVYTRPETFLWKKQRYSIPDVLIGGHHKKIEDWKKQERNRYKDIYEK